MPKTATRKKPTAASVAEILREHDLPAIGAKLDGGIYAGLSLADNEPVALVLLPGDVEKNWKDAVAWATEQGGTLPSRIDALVLFQNARDDFKREAYWTGQPYAGDERFAWYQPFDYGYQFSHHKGYELRARAVRRLKLAL